MSYPSPFSDARAYLDERLRQAEGDTLEERVRAVFADASEVEVRALVWALAPDPPISEVVAAAMRHLTTDNPPFPEPSEGGEPPGDVE